MSRLRFKLSSLLILFTFFAVSLGLGYRIHTLSVQVDELKSQLASTKQSTQIRIAYPAISQQPTAQPGTSPASPPAKQSPFRLLDNSIHFDPSVEEGTKASDRHLQQHWKRELQQQIDSPIEAPPRSAPRGW